MSAHELSPENETQKSDDTAKKEDNDSNPVITVKLLQDKLYHLQCEKLGYFRIRGGSTGIFRLKGIPVSILDSSDNCIFSNGGKGKDYVYFNDCSISEDAHSVVTYIPEGSPYLQAMEESFPLAPFGIIQIAAVNNEKISLRRGTAVVTGNGSKLELCGRANVTVNGNIKECFMCNRTHLTVQGNVGGNLAQKSGRSHLRVEGNIIGDVFQRGSGVMMITGDVVGMITQIGKGFIHISGVHEGRTHKHGTGDIQIVGGAPCQLTDPEDDDTYFDE